MVERVEAVSHAPVDYTPIGAAERVERQPSGLRLVTAAGTVEITVLAADLFRVGLFPPGQPLAYPSEAVAKTDWRPGAVDLLEREGEWRIETPVAAARVRLDPVRIGFEDAAGRTFAEDDPDLGMGYLPAVAPTVAFADAAGRPVRLFKQHLEGERYFGCGERTSRLEKTNSHQVFWNVDPPIGHTASLNNLYTSIPFLLTLRQGAAWGLLLDSTYRVEFDLAREQPERAWFGADGGSLVYYVFTGPTPRTVLERYTELTGRTPMPPLWSLGNQQSSWGYESAEQVRAIAREFRARDIPCDALYLDIDYMDGYRVFTWHPDRFPDPEGFTDDLHKQGFRVVTIVDPGVKVDVEYPVYVAGRDADLYCKTADGEEYRNVVWPGICAFPDFTNPHARAWWGGLHAALLDAGVDGIWCDMNEPALFVPSHSTMPPTVVHPGGGTPAFHGQVHNAYGLLMARATREGVARLRPDRRPFVISRSGYAGLQRYALQWTGDNSSWWEHLWMSMPQLQNMGLSGIAWAGVDVGGFAGDADGELLTRWTEFGIFQPFCRNHTAKGTRPQEPWAFGERYEMPIRQMLKLRQRLLPYLYSLFDESHRTGAPILRPLLFEYPEDETTYTADDQFMLGSALLIAPITRPGVEHRHVYLPEGAWFQFWTGERCDGPAHILAHAPLGRPAIYIRANRPLPLWPAMNYAGERPADPLSLLVYPAEGSGEFTLYEDAGDGFEHERGVYARTRITCETSSTGTMIQLAEREGSWTPPRRTVELELRGQAAPPAEVRANGEPISDQRFADGTLILRLPATMTARTVEVLFGPDVR